MLSSTTKQKIDNARNILVGKIPTPTGQVEHITLALMYKFMHDMDELSKSSTHGNASWTRAYPRTSE
jgi:type I restriction enzyme M protein